MSLPDAPSKLKGLDDALRAEVEALLIEHRIWQFSSFGWQNAYDADPEFVGHAMWQVEPAVDFAFSTSARFYPTSPENWKRDLSIVGADFEGLMRAARNSIGLLLFQIALRPNSFAPDDELFDLHSMSSLIYLATATDRLRSFFILAAFREAQNEYLSRGKTFQGWKRTDYTTPFLEARHLYDQSSREILEALESLIPLVDEICALRKQRNALIHETATILGRRELQLMETADDPPPVADMSFQEMKVAVSSHREIQEKQISDLKARLARWYLLLMKTINEAYIFEHYRRR